MLCYFGAICKLNISSFYANNILYVICKCVYLVYVHFIYIKKRYFYKSDNKF